MFTYYKNRQNVIYAYTEEQTPLADLIPISEQEKDQILVEQEQSLIAAMPYDVKRKNAYPPITDYLDAVVKGDQAQLAEYISTCLAVKARYPKP